MIDKNLYRMAPISGLDCTDDPGDCSTPVTQKVIYSQEEKC
jgi:hypothetical protein